MALTRDHLFLARSCYRVYSKNLNESTDKYFESVETGCQGIVFKDGSRIIVCFRGSDSVLDWKMNFQLSLNNYPCTSERKVHEGFLVQWFSVKNIVLDFIEDILEESANDEMEPIKTIVFTGHSAGGGHSTIASSDMYEYCTKLKLESELVTFGSPRVGNKEFSEDAESKIKCTRIVLDRDAVTQAPASILGYQHIGHTIQMRDNEILEKEPTWLESFHWMLTGIPYLDLGARDHMVWNYVKEIAKWLVVEEK